MLGRGELHSGPYGVREWGQKNKNKQTKMYPLLDVSLMMLYGMTYGKRIH